MNEVINSVDAYGLELVLYVNSILYDIIVSRLDYFWGLLWSDFFKDFLIKSELSLKRYLEDIIASFHIE